jgi:hypothetical protein
LVDAPTAEESATINNDVVKQLRKLTQLTSLHCLSSGSGIDPLSLNIQSILKHPLTLTNLQELKVDQNYHNDSTKQLEHKDAVVDVDQLGNLDSLDKLTSFGCGQTSFLPQLNKLTHLDLSAQNFYPRSIGIASSNTTTTQIPYQDSNRRAEFIETFENGRSNTVTSFTIEIIQKYAPTITHVILPNYPGVDPIVQMEFVHALHSCSRLREVTFPATWNQIGSQYSQLSFIGLLHKLRPDVQLRRQ